MKKTRYTVGSCTRYLPLTDRECGRPARFEIYDGLQRLCKQCHQRYRAGKETLFDPGSPPTAAELWAFQQRMSSLVPER